MSAAYDVMRRGAVQDGMTSLSSGLDHIRRCASPAEWKAITRAAAAHPLHAMLQEDPLTRHAHDRPRGYPGDPNLLDYLYGIEAPPPSTSAIGRAIFSYAIKSAAAKGVRARRKLIARKIDHLTERPGMSQITSVGCGHAREWELIEPMSRRSISRFAAIACDARTLDDLESRIPMDTLHRRHAGVHSLLTGTVRIPRADLVYSAGLYDYLSDDLGARLARRMFDALLPGGTLLITSFAPNVRDVAYMELFMRCSLIYRTEHYMSRLLRELPVPQITRTQTYRIHGTDVVVVEVTKTRVTDLWSRRLQHHDGLRG